ncbi:MAG: outer membrane protein [Candidatus Sulfotelmatobacter sp.]
MSGKRLWIAVLFLVTLAVSLAAQDEKNDLGGSIGRSFISTQALTQCTAPCFDPYIRYGKGLTIEGSYARRFLVTPVFAVAAELPVLYNPDEDLHAGGSGLVPQDYKALFIAPSLRVNLFPTTAVSLWGSVGGGFGHISQNKSLLYGGTNTGASTTSGVLQYGIGLDVKLTKRMVLRAEGRDFWAGEPDFPQAPTGKTRQHNYFLGIGAIWRF